MAEIVLGIASSRSPMTSIPPTSWPLMGERDQRSTRLRRGNGKDVTYQELLDSVSPAVAEAIKPAVWQQQYDTAQKHIETLAGTLEDANPDVLVVLGDDEEEFINGDNRPGILAYRGETFPTIPRIPSATSNDPIGSQGAWAWGDVAVDQPVAVDLANHVINHLLEANFDLAESSSLTPLKPEAERQGHVFGWVYKRLIQNHARPILPYILNVHYPLNQPSPRRCYELGQAINKAIAAWDSDLRVAVVTAGGLSVGVLEQEIDSMALSAMASHDVDAIATLNRDWT